MSTLTPVIVLLASSCPSSSWSFQTWMRSFLFFWGKASWGSFTQIFKKSSGKIQEPPGDWSWSLGKGLKWKLSPNLTRSSMKEVYFLLQRFHSSDQICQRTIWRTGRWPIGRPGWSLQRGLWNPWLRSTRRPPLDFYHSFTTVWQNGKMFILKM